ncbi:MAG TPA: SDR family oxidoreductase [Polyangiales bacterium]
METAEKTLLLTGFPSSFVARKLLPRLLSRGPADRVKCLVPEGSLDKAAEHLRELDKERSGRIEIVKGDTAAMDFGMAGPAFVELARSVNVVHHCAAAAHAGVSREVAERLNVGGAGEIVDLALASDGHVERVVHWSSALLCGKRSGRVLESELVEPPGSRGVVDETRFRAELLMREAMSSLPITILRPSIVVGDSKTGEIDRMEGPYLLILLMLSSPVDLRVPLPGRGDQPLHLVPIDYVVDAGVAISRDPRSRGRTFHIVDEQPLTVRRVFELIAEAAGRPGPVGSLPTNLANALLRTPGLERLSQIPRTFLEQLATEVVYDSRNTRELLVGTGLQCPTAATYLKGMVDHVRGEQAKRGKARKAAKNPHFEEMEDPLDH